MNIAIVVSEFNKPITSKLLAGALNYLKQADIAESQITVTHVPGAVEIPLLAQHYAKNKKYAAVICLGAVIRGETSHYDYVCQQVSYGCQKIALQYEKPIVFGVLTTEDAAQALARAGGAKGNKGAEAAEVALTMIDLLK